MVFLLFLIFFGLASVILAVIAFKQEDLVRKVLAYCSLACVAFTAIVVVINIFIIVPAGHVAVGVLFGDTQKGNYEQGFHWVNPLFSFHETSIQRQVINYIVERGKEAKEKTVGEEGIEALSKDNLLLKVDASCPFKLNPAYAWWIYKNVSFNYVEQLVKPAGRSALRDALAQYKFVDAGTEQREKLAIMMTSAFEQHLVGDLIRQGLSENEAKKVFAVLPVQLRQVLPPDKVQNSIAEKVAADQDLQKQRTLTSIAEEVARRRKNEGEGIRKLFGELPKDITPSDMAKILNAMATKENADAFMKAVESGQVKNIIFGANPSPAIPMQ
jgi:regulator of protease activity HflC (stomatin/prohibitin superfamily)